MLKKINRISSRKEFLKIKNEGGMFNSSLFGAIGLNDKTNEIKFGFIISKKISKKAVDRNKIKRRMCEALRVKLNDLKPGTKIIFLAKQGLLKANMAEIKSEVNKILDSSL